MTADLHVHTTFSDGAHTPAEAIHAARAAGLHAISLTDHDTTAMTQYARALGGRAGLTVIPGVEISAYDFRRGRRIHILGYSYRTPATAIEDLCRPVREARDAMTRLQIATLRHAGYPVDEAAVRRVAKSAMSAAELELWPGVLYKQHIMAVLIERGVADAVYGTVYRTLFKGNGLCAGEISYVDVFDAVAAIKDDGGIAVLAHPGQQDSFDLVAPLSEAGLDGIELHHEDHSGEHEQRVRDLAAEYGLILTGGSDAHGSLGSIHPIGSIRAPEGAVEAIRRAAASGGITTT